MIKLYGEFYRGAVLRIGRISMGQSYTTVYSLDVPEAGYESIYFKRFFDQDGVEVDIYRVFNPYQKTPVPDLDQTAGDDYAVWDTQEYMLDQILCSFCQIKERDCSSCMVLAELKEHMAMGVNAVMKGRDYIF